MERLFTHYTSMGGTSEVPEAFRGFTEEALVGPRPAGGRERQEAPGIHATVHRLDEGTSGILLIAKTTAAGVSLRQQFRDRTVKKVYIAVTHQGLRCAMSITSGIGRAPCDRRKMQSARQIAGISAASAPLARGKVRGAITFFKPLLFNGKWGVVLASPVTGRTHQIRLHLQMLKTPIIGDTLYGDPAANSYFLACMRARRGPNQVSQPREEGPCLRPLLHAAQVSCMHPITREILSVSASLPRDMREAISAVDSSWSTIPELGPFAKGPLQRASDGVDP